MLEGQASIVQLSGPWTEKCFPLNVGENSLITFKLIYHLSYPVGKIVNDYIDFLCVCLVLNTTFNQCETEYGICFLFATDAFKWSWFLYALISKVNFKRVLFR